MTKLLIESVKSTPSGYDMNVKTLVQSGGQTKTGTGVLARIDVREGTVTITNGVIEVTAISAESAEDADKLSELELGWLLRGRRLPVGTILRLIPKLNSAMGSYRPTFVMSDIQQGEGQ